jgi:hypothetical protein
MLRIMRDPQRLSRIRHRAGMVSLDEANRPHRFRVALLGGEPAMFVGYLGYVGAADEETAIEAAAKEFNIAQRDRLVARRDE